METIRNNDMEVEAKILYYGHEYPVERQEVWNSIPELSKFVLSVERKKK